MALAEAEGDEERGKALYLKLRAPELCRGDAFELVQEWLPAGDHLEGWVARGRPRPRSTNVVHLAA